MAITINRITLSVAVFILFGIGLISENVLIPSQPEEEASLTTYIEFTNPDAESQPATFDDGEIENSLLVVFQHEMIDGAGTWVCSGMAFSDDLNRACRLAITTRVGLVRLFAIANANNSEYIRAMLNSHQLDNKKLPTLDMLACSLFKVENRNDRLVRVKDTTLLLTDEDGGRSISIGLKCLAEH